MFNRLYLLAFAILFSSCANTDAPPRRSLFTVAIVGERVLIGIARPLGSSMSFEMKSLYKPPLDCTGQTLHTFRVNGTTNVQCSDGARGSAQLIDKGNNRGIGKGTSSLGPIHMAYGYTIKQMNELLKFPGDKVLAIENGTYKLINQKR